MRRLDSMGQVDVATKLREHLQAGVARLLRDGTARRTDAVALDRRRERRGRASVVATRSGVTGAAYEWVK